MLREGSGGGGSVAGPVAANELRQVQRLMWGIIATKLNPAEVDEVRPMPVNSAHPYPPPTPSPRHADHTSQPHE
jgi:hypothetical protein